MNQGIMIGGGLLVAGLLLFWIAMPRQGQVVSFLRYRDSYQALYMMVIVTMLALGFVMILSNQ